MSLARCAQILEWPRSYRSAIHLRSRRAPLGSRLAGTPSEGKIGVEIFLSSRCLRLPGLNDCSCTITHALAGEFVSGARSVMGTILLGLGIGLTIAGAVLKFRNSEKRVLIFVVALLAIAVGAGKSIWGQMVANQHNTAVQKDSDGLRSMLYPPASDL
jgi:hypothetical protein